MIHYERCPLCASPGIQKVFTAKDYTVSQSGFEIWQCAHCSVRFTQNIPEPENIGAYYKSESYISHTETNKGIVNWLYLKVRRYTLATKHRLIQQELGIDKGSLLDIGAGTGAFVHYMQERGWRVEGLEPDNGAIERAALQYGLHLKNSADLYKLPATSYDAVTMWHVLEHVHDLHGYLDQVKKILKPEGRAFIAVPNFTSMDADLYGAEWAAYDVPRHLYHFSPASMHQLAAQHGLAIRKMQPMWFDSFYVSLLSEKNSKGHSGLIKGFINGMRSNMKAWSNSRKASSIIYVLAHQVPA